MNEKVLTAFGIALPFFGTALGAAAVFIFKNNAHGKGKRLLLGFASGVMMAASVWSLLLPAYEASAEMGKRSVFPVCGGFLCGSALILLCDRFLPEEKAQAEAAGSKVGKNAMLLFAVTLHNLPEGMAVGVSFAGCLSDKSTSPLSCAMALSLGIALQNLPEGAIISLPAAAEGGKKRRAFLLGVLSGAVEPVGALITLILTAQISAALPFLLAFAAGAMIYVVAEELIPRAQEEGGTVLPSIGVILGFSLMMVMDVTLG